MALRGFNGRMVGVWARSQSVIRGFLPTLFLAAALESGCNKNRPASPTDTPGPFLSDDSGLGPVNLNVPPGSRHAFQEALSAPEQITPNVPAYALPLRPADLSNFGAFSSALPISEAAVNLLSRNGFAVVRTPLMKDAQDMAAPYKTLREAGVPLFITTDSLLHLYHIQFDETLRQIEEREFYGLIWDISRAMSDISAKQYGGLTGEPQEAARRNAAYFAVALSLLQPHQDQLCPASASCRDPAILSAYFGEEDLGRYRAEVPSFATKDVEAELKLIQAHGGLAPSPLFLYKEDYSQYLPRGHYTRSEKLKNYFLAMMWYGRMAMLLKGSSETISSADATIQTMQASLIASRFAADAALLEKWRRIYDVTAFYVGLSDDLGPMEYLQAMNLVFKGAFRPAELTAQSIETLKVELAKLPSPKIYGGTGGCRVRSVEEAEKCLADTAGMRFMGQRFIPDSYMMSEIVAPYSGGFTGTGWPFTVVQTDLGPMRGFPRGLDVMALLGSSRAKALLKALGDSDYADYDTVFEKLRKEFAALGPAEWSKNLYWSWLYALQSLLTEFGEGFPAFMQTVAWQDKELTTALSSWAQLRHDTILYAKQSYTMRIEMAPPPPPRVVGYVEPVPEFYARLLNLSRMTREGLAQMNVLDETQQSRLASMEAILQRLLDLSKQELENVELSEKDYDFIANFADALNDVIADVDEKAKLTTIIADVHTDLNTEKVLEEGTGYVRLMVVAYKVPDGRILVGTGPVFSYYEFKQPMADRLTDEKWRELLASNPPGDPEWVAGFTE